jgi:hypothetical protein
MAYSNFHNKRNIKNFKVKKQCYTFVVNATYVIAYPKQCYREASETKTLLEI